MDWFAHGASCYRIFDTPTAKWSDARSHCQNLGADLSVIRSAEEDNFILDLITKQNTVTRGGAWLGLHRNNDSKLYWIDGTVTPLEGVYSGWISGQPDNHRGSENCAHMYGKGPNTGKWNDVNCDVGSWLSNAAPVILCQKHMA